MTTLTIEQGNNIEIVSYAVIQKLYETALDSTNVTLSGNLQCEHCFENAYDYLTGYVTEGVKRFPNLLINVTDGKYISFADPNIEKVIVNIWSNGNPGITLAEISTHDRINFEETDGLYNTNNSFRNNLTITTFNELGRFTSIKTIARHQFQSSSLSSIDLSNIEAINWSAFNGCSNLTGVIDLPNIVSIGDAGIAAQTGGSFSNCSGITEVNFGPNLTTFYSTDAFKNCSSLQKVTGFKTPNNLIGNACFSRCSSLTTVEGLDFSTITYVGDYAFENTSNLTISNLALPSLTQAKTGCFKGSGVVTVSDLGSTITLLANSMFKSCTSLTSIAIPNLVVSISGECFRGCTSLTSINLNNVTSIIGNSAFQGSGLLSIDLSNMTSFSTSAFQDCISLTSITLPRIEKWGKLNDLNLYTEATSLFKNTGITSITIPKETKIISDASFQGCKSLTQISFESGTLIKKIGNSAFRNCTALLSVILPEGVEIIDNVAFSELTNLKYIEFPSTVTSLGTTNAAFFHNGTGNWSFVIKATTPPTLNSLGYMYGTLKIYVPDASVNTYKTDTNWSQYSDRIYGISELPSQ